MSTTSDDAPPGWYDDPGNVGDQRYWDGTRWTDGIVVDDHVGEQPLPLEPLDPDRRADLPAVGAGLALLGVVVGVGSGALAGLAARALTGELIVEVAAGQLGLWAGLLGAVVMASRRYGSGSLREDHQLVVEGLDVGLGVVLSLAARLAASIAAVAAAAATGADRFPDQLDVADGQRSVMVLTLVFALVGAPIVEELFFRGLLQRSLEPVLRTWGAIVVQGLLFGCAHALTSASWQENVVVASSLTAVGVTAGVTVHCTKRLATSMWLHFFFNLFAVAVAVARW